MDEEELDYFLPPAEHEPAYNTVAALGAATFPAGFLHDACRQSLAATRQQLALLGDVMLAGSEIAPFAESGWNEPAEEGLEATDEAAVMHDATDAPMLSERLRQIASPTAEQRRQHLLSWMYHASNVLIEHSNPARFGTWPARVDGHPAIVTQEAYELPPSSPDGQKIYARLALFAPERHYDGTEEPCIIVSLQPAEATDITSCGDNRRGIVVSFYRRDNRIMLMGRRDPNLPAYTADHPEDIEFAERIIRDIGRQKIEKLKRQEMLAPEQL